MTAPSSIAIQPDGGALSSAVLWLQHTLLGTVATSVAVVAVAMVGIGMLTGRVDIRRAVSVVIGCFIVFGASGIAAGIRSALSNAGEPAGSTSIDNGSYSRAVPDAIATAVVDDPYAGASVRR